MVKEGSSNHNHSARLLLYGLLLTLLVCLLSFVGGAVAQRLMAQRQEELRNRPLAVFWEAWDLLDEYFYGDLPSPQERTYGAIRGMLGLLNDPYTLFLEPQPGEIERDQLNGAYGGIGVDLWRDPDGRVVLSPYPNSPAEEAGVQAGDVLLAVDHQSIDASGLDDIRTRLRGEVGTTVTLTIARPPTPSFDLPVARAEIQIPSVTSRMLDQAPSIGYLHITGFTSRTPDEAREAVNSLLAAGASQIVLDLRDDGGGLIQSAVDVAGLFLDDRVVLIEAGRGQESVFRTDSGSVAADLPLVILVNGSTASAAEVVAGALQVYERGTLIGEQTFGKGVVQHIYTLSDGSSLHVTFAAWLLPNHNPIPPDGLVPDIPVAATGDLQDAALERAIHYFQVGE